jgi:MFS transporter, PPP family, 3-phenylpropionic acid transporter
MLSVRWPGAGPDRATDAQAVSLAVRLSCYFGAVFLAYGVVVPYFPVWLHARGLSPVEISTVTAAPLFVRVLFTPTVLLLADRLQNYRAVLIAMSWSVLALALGLSAVSGFWAILALGVAFLLALGTCSPLVDTFAVAGVRTAGLDYGRMRLWGSITFIAANFVGGVLIEALGGGFGIWLIAFAAALAVVAAHMLPPPPGRTPTRAALSLANWRRSFPVRLLSSRLFLLFLVAIGCTHGAHATFYTFGALHWQAQGLSAAWVGVLWAIGVTAEVVLFAFSAPVVRRFSAAQLIVAGAGGALVRWTVMAFDPLLALLVPLQTLHALTYSAAHLGAILFITRAVSPKGQGSAQAFYSVIAAGVILGIVGLISGALYESLGGRVYLVPAAVSLVGLAAGLLLMKEWSGGLVWREEELPPVPSPTNPAAGG